MQGIFWEGNIEDNYIGHILAEIYKDRVYLRFLDGKKDLNILDIGANIGLTAQYFSNYASKVWAIEPAKEHFNCLTHMLEFNKIENVIPLNMAVYKETGEFELGHNENKTMFSLHSAIWDKKFASEKVKAITLPDLFKEQGIEHIDFMKLDVEGSEQEIIGHISFTEVAPKIDFIVMELHVWSGRHPHQAIEALKNNGYDVETVPNDANILIAKRK